VYNLGTPRFSTTRYKVSPSFTGPYTFGNALAHFGTGDFAVLSVFFVLHAVFPRGFGAGLAVFLADVFATAEAFSTVGSVCGADGTLRASVLVGDGGLALAVTVFSEGCVWEATGVVNGEADNVMA
jgi:hypothetical protein